MSFRDGRKRAGPAGDAEDRLVFAELKSRPHGTAGTATVYYSPDPKDALHGVRLQFLQSRGVDWVPGLRPDTNR